MMEASGRHEAVTGEKESHGDDPRDESGNDDAAGRQTAEDGQVRSDALSSQRPRPSSR